eukprot:5925069-Prymnesium_polylepis.1
MARRGVRCVRGPGGERGESAAPRGSTSVRKSSTGDGRGGVLRTREVRTLPGAPVRKRRRLVGSRRAEQA